MEGLNEKSSEFNETKRLGKEHRVYLKKKEDYMNCIYDKIIEKDFNICDYEDYGLTEEQINKVLTENGNLENFSIEE